MAELRWATPIYPEYQEGVKHDTSTKKCPQAQDDSGSEDCLYLDVYVPKKIWDTRNDDKAIHREFFSLQRLLRCLTSMGKCVLTRDSQLLQ